MASKSQYEDSISLMASFTRWKDRQSKEFVTVLAEFGILCLIALGWMPEDIALIAMVIICGTHALRYAEDIMGCSATEQFAGERRH